MFLSEPKSPLKYFKRIRLFQETDSLYLPLPLLAPSLTTCPSLKPSSVIFLPYLYLLSPLLLCPLSSHLSYHSPGFPSSVYFPYLFLSCSIPPSVSPGLDWWCVEVRQTDGGWGIAPASLGPIQAWEMIDVKSKFKHPQLNFSRQTESGGQRLATQLGQPDKTYGSSLPGGVFVCCLLTWNSWKQVPSVLSWWPLL